MKKIALAAFSATALLALSACGGTEEEAPVVEETTMVEELPAPVASDTAVPADVVATEAPATEAPAE